MLYDGYWYLIKDYTLPSIYVCESTTKKTKVKLSIFKTNFEIYIFSDLRLAGPSKSNEGILEVFENGAWNRVCSSKWTSNESLAACRELGYSNAIPGNITDTSYNEVADLRIEISCNGRESKISECTEKPKRIEACTSWELVFVRCHEVERGTELWTNITFEIAIKLIRTSESSSEIHEKFSVHVYMYLRIMLK